MGLQLSKSPDLATPLRYFLTAPLFGMAAGLALIFAGADALASRWTPAALAITHLITLGFFAMVMLGALFQVLPVAVGGIVPQSRIAARLVHAGLVIGTLLLSAGLWRGSALLLYPAAALLATTFVGFVSAAIGGVRAADANLDTLGGIRYALAGLGITVTLGLLLALANAGTPLPGVGREWTDLHAVWGTLGWMGLLVIAVSFEVLPTFQLTPPYPETIRRRWPALLFCALMLWSLTLVLARKGAWAGLGWPSWVAGAMLIAGFVIYTGVTLYLQQQRKKPVQDPHVWGWRLAMAGLASGLAGTALLESLPAEIPSNAPQLMTVMLTLFVFGLSVINTMLHKIIPFLVWLHLTLAVTERKLSRKLVTNVKEIIPTGAVWLQLAVHTLAMALLILAPWAPQYLAPAAGLVIAASNLLLLRNLLIGVRVHHNKLPEIAAMPGPQT